MKLNVANAVKTLTLAKPRYFYPARVWKHMNVIAHGDKYDGPQGKKGKYDPYFVPRSKDKEEQKEIDESTLFGSTDILSMRYVSDEEWRNDNDADSKLGSEYAALFQDASSALTELFGEPAIRGRLTESVFRTPFGKELAKICIGDMTEFKVWTPFCKTQHYYLVCSKGSGDGDLIAILWLCCLVEEDYDEDDYNDDWPWD